MIEPTPEEKEAWDRKLGEIRKSQFGDVVSELTAVKDIPERWRSSRTVS